MTGNPSNRREREWLARRNEILEAAAGLYAELGYAGTTMQAIAERAGFSVGYLYRHFESKLAIATALVDREIAFFDQISEEIEAGGQSPLATYRLMMERLCEHLTTRRDLVRVFARETLLQRLPERSGRIEKFRRLDVELLKSAYAAGELPLMDFDLLSAVLSGVFDNLMMTLAEEDDPEAMRRIPGLVFQFVLEPLTRRAAGGDPRKEASDAQHHRTEA